ncbi:hypothetical protein C2E23DRAFT_833126 [Lenzites betulinus]|nr:hypothetical protein C2E23DRAFT_833126 [Lenzites betulinus]
MLPHRILWMFLGQTFSAISDSTYDTHDQRQLPKAMSAQAACLGLGRRPIRHTRHQVGGRLTLSVSPYPISRQSETDVINWEIDTTNYQVYFGSLHSGVRAAACCSLLHTVGYVHCITFVHYRPREHPTTYATLSQPVDSPSKATLEHLAQTHLSTAGAAGPRPAKLQLG